jgi:hypothetical protein
MTIPTSTRFAAESIRSDMEASARDPLRIRFLIQDRDERRCVDNHFGTPISS